MPLPPADPSRSLQHLRSVEIQAWRRDDGFWDLDAHLRDLRPAVRLSDDPVHDLQLRVTVDLHLDIVDAAASYEAAPYDGVCDRIAPDYSKLVGLNLARDFRRQVHARLGGTRGCAHLSELAQLLPTAAIQALAAERGGVQTRAAPAEQGARPPSHLDRCHALARDGDTVRLHYPQWYSPKRQD